MHDFIILHMMVKLTEIKMKFSANLKMHQNSAHGSTIIITSHDCEVGSSGWQRMRLSDDVVSCNWSVSVTHCESITDDIVIALGYGCSQLRSVSLSTCRSVTDVDAPVIGEYDIFGVVWNQMIALLLYVIRSNFIESFGWELFTI